MEEIKTRARNYRAREELIEGLLGLVTLVLFTGGTFILTLLKVL